MGSCTKVILSLVHHVLSEVCNATTRLAKHLPNSSPQQARIATLSDLTFIPSHCIFF